MPKLHAGRRRQPISHTGQGLDVEGNRCEPDPDPQGIEVIGASARRSTCVVRPGSFRIAGAVNGYSVTGSLTPVRWVTGPMRASVRRRWPGSSRVQATMLSVPTKPQSERPPYGRPRCPSPDVRQRRLAQQRQHDYTHRRDQHQSDAPSAHSVSLRVRVKSMRHSSAAGGPFAELARAIGVPDHDEAMEGRMRPRSPTRLTDATMPSKCGRR
jgi:hypothetical protein